MKEVILSFKNITKTFLGGHIIANDNISLEIYKNEIHTIIGENGSGKSTLTSVLFGLYKQDQGTIELNGQKVEMYEPGAAKKHKIGMVHQHFHLVNEFTVLDNILIGQEKEFTRFGFINRKKALKRFEEISKKYSIKLDPNKIVRKLNVGDRQKVEIFKTLWTSKSIIIFDEPTATLSVDEIEKLLTTILNLKKEGKTIIFISHKLKEVKRISDRISVLRKGKLISTKNNDSKLDIDQIAKDMIGELVKLNYQKTKVKNEVLLQVKDLQYLTSMGFEALQPTSFEIKKGEIFGLAGIQDNGQEEIIDTIAGVRKSSSGTITLFSNNLNYQKLLSEKYRNQGQVAIDKLDVNERNEIFAHIPIDRLKHGVVLDMNLTFNSILSNFSSNQFNKYSLNEDDNFFVKSYKNTQSKLKLLNSSKINELTENIIKSMNVEGASSTSIPIRNLSGGNQQKFVVGREMSKNFSLLLAGHPTRGLDIKAIDHIYKTMLNHLEKNSDSAILLYSLELHELMAVCNRIAVMYKGKIVGIVDPSKTSVDKISKMMMGEVESKYEPNLTEKISIDPKQLEIDEEFLSQSTISSLEDSKKQIKKKLIVSKKKITKKVGDK